MVGATPSFWMIGIIRLRKMCVLNLHDMEINIHVSMYSI